MIIWLLKTIADFFLALIMWFIIKPIFWLMQLFCGREHANIQKERFIQWLEHTSARMRDSQKK